MIFATQTDSDKVTFLVALAEELQQDVEQAIEAGLSLHRVERFIFDKVHEIGFAAVEQLLHGQGDGDLGEAVTTETGQVLIRSDEPVARPVRTVFGLHTFHAFVYSPGPNQKIALRPVDARLQLPPGRASYLFEEFSQFFCVDQVFGAAQRGIHLTLKQTVSVNSLEQINQRLGSQAEAFLDQLPTPPAAEEGELLVFTGDGKGVPMVQQDAAKLLPFEPSDRPGNRRMATLAGVYSVDRHVRTPEEIVAALFRDGQRPRRDRRPRPRFKHIRGSFARLYNAEGDDPTVVPGAFEAFAWANTQTTERLKPEQVLIRLMDGQPSLWNAADACLDVEPERSVDILDIVHVSQYVWKAAKALHRSFEHREAFARERLLRILQGDVRGVISGLRQMATKRNLTGPAKRDVAQVCGYFEKNAARMRYDEYLREGYPIASGVIEGACRHFVKDRMERSGMRWCLAGAQAMLNVRAIYLSSYWDDFQTWRIAQEQQHMHPHRNLIQNYSPVTIGA